METVVTPSNIMFALGIIGIIFSIFNYFRNPQEALDKRTAVDREESEGRAKILEQRLQWEKDATDKKFFDMGIRLDNSMSLAQNHTHTVDVKVDKLIESVNMLAIQVGKLETKIEDRIPLRVV